MEIPASRKNDCAGLLLGDQVLLPSNHGVPRPASGLGHPAPFPQGYLHAACVRSCRPAVLPSQPATATPGRPSRTADAFPQARASAWRPSPRAPALATPVSARLLGCSCLPSTPPFLVTPPGNQANESLVGKGPPTARQGWGGPALMAPPPTHPCGLVGASLSLLPPFTAPPH